MSEHPKLVTCYTCVGSTTLWSRGRATPCPRCAGVGKVYETKPVPKPVPAPRPRYIDDALF